MLLDCIYILYMEQSWWCVGILFHCTNKTKSLSLSVLAINLYVHIRFRYIDTYIYEYIVYIYTYIYEYIIEAVLKSLMS